MKKKIKVDEQTQILLNEFKEKYKPKNKIIDKIIVNAQKDLSKGQVPQVVLKRFVSSIYWTVFTEKITVGDSVSEILKKMDKLSRSNGYLPFGTLFNIRL